MIQMVLYRKKKKSRQKTYHYPKKIEPVQRRRKASEDDFPWKERKAKKLKG